MMFFETRNILAFIFIAILVFSGLIFIGDYKEIKMHLSDVKITTLIVLFALSLGNYIIRFIKWHFFLNILKIRVSFADSFLIFLSGLSMSLTPAKIGETIKSYFLDKIEKVNVKRSLPIIFGERLTDLFGLIILSLVGISSIFLNVNFLIALLIVLLMVLFSIRNEKVFYFFVRQIARIKFFRKYLKDIDIFHGSLKELLSIWPMSVSIVLSILSWGLEAYALYYLVTSLGVNIAPFTILFIYSFSSIVGALAFIPGGLGITEGSLLSLLVFAGLPVSIGSLVTIIIRVATLWFGVSLGLLSLLILSKRIKR